MRRNSGGAGCGGGCWEVESAGRFSAFEYEPNGGDFVPLYHCYRGGNFYQHTPCAAGEEGVPHLLGWLSEGIWGTFGSEVFACPWSANGVNEEFLTLSRTECTNIGRSPRSLGFGGP